MKSNQYQRPPPKAGAFLYGQPTRYSKWSTTLFAVIDSRTLNFYAFFPGL
ncbi:hypothetical protein PSJ8397_01235 [Pseudooctadecabacter jejudonensis]|uniref:Uncharacterized protein n=1 Tax=Pseudooctadecabacter jejudonensis TaxID=1391910 RepID=A0A1Y5RYZ2_9RHOB|nr:hypothetical protein PSJ8397_01235 [Pseudooctadecabacter jejudonensis]